MQLTIRETVSGEPVAVAGDGQFQEIEGNWYVDPAAVRTEHLKLTDQEYHCPYKGRCLYVDFDDGTRTVSRVAWVYDQLKPAWEHIRGKYGFYRGETARSFGCTSDDVTP